MPGQETFFLHEYVLAQDDKDEWNHEQRVNRQKKNGPEYFGY